MNNSFIAFFSCTGNTKKIAETIAELTKSSLYAITPQKPYSTEDLNWEDPYSRSSFEKNDWSIHPTIAGKDPDISAYSNIFLGFPIWWDTTPNIITTFLTSHDFNDKTIIPFCTSGSSNPEDVLDKMKRYLPQSTTVLPAVRFTPNITQAEIQTWLNTLDL